MFLDMQDIFWKPYRKRCQLKQRKETVSRDYDSVWIAVMDSTLDQTRFTPDQLHNNDIKEETSDEHKEEIMELKGKSVSIEERNGLTTVKCKSNSINVRKSKNINTNRDICKESTDTQESYQCTECGKCFKLKDSYMRHMRIHNDERPFTCHICGKQFRDSGGLSRHLKDVHAKLKNFTCDICEKSFASKATRDDHRRTHTGERPFICDCCGKTFKSKASLYIHSKLHTNEFPHPCSYCNKKFRRKQEMLAHITTHTGEKNYGCDICSKRFRVKSELVRHKLIHSECKPFVCVKCGLAFRQKRYLNNHLKSRHVDSLRAC